MLSFLTTLCNQIGLPGSENEMSTEPNPRFKSTFSRFTLRHNIVDGEQTLEVKAEIIQKLTITKAELQLNNQIIPLRKIR